MYKLLIADDETEIREGLANYFPWDNLGFEVVNKLDNGLKAYDYIKRHPVDAALCDIRMPVMSGIELAEKLHGEGSPTKIILLSGYAEFQYAQKAIEYGVKRYIVKPAKYHEIIEVIGQLRDELDSERTGSEDGRNMPDKKENFNMREEIITQVQEYVQSDFRNATLENAAKQVFFNPAYLSKFFKEKTGENFSDYLLKIRMQKASELLKNIKYKTYDVSSTVGYTNPKNFARAFKKFYGVSPHDYRYGKNPK